jgi:hypothetical protein
VRESKLDRCRGGHLREAVVGGVMKYEESKRLKNLEDENRRLK